MSIGWLILATAGVAVVWVALIAWAWVLFKGAEDGD